MIERAFNMIERAFIPLPMRIYVYHIAMIDQIETPLRKRVGGIHDPHTACLLDLIDSLKGDDRAKGSSTFRNLIKNSMMSYTSID